jgi:SAM-dependent methyltransferase
MPNKKSNDYSGEAFHQPQDDYPRATAKMPTAKAGLVSTLNKYGYMTTYLDPFSQQFVEFASKHNTERFLEIGAAYGIATLAALARGAHVMANDLEQQHLAILQERVPKEQLPRLTLHPGAFPDGLTLPDNHFMGILVCRVIHFFDGKTVEHAVKKLLDWLKPGGKAFVVIETPYIKPLEPFIKKFEQRKAEGNPWPGLINDMKELNRDPAKNVPALLHPMDDDILKRVFGDAGFLIEKCHLFSRPEFPEQFQLDGRESAGIIAVKPG